MRSGVFTLACSAQLDPAARSAPPCCVQLNFPAGPPADIAAVMQACDAALTAEARGRGLGPFRSAGLKVYDYNLHEWRELSHIAQLVPGGQIHAEPALSPRAHTGTRTSALRLQPRPAGSRSGSPTAVGALGERPYVSREEKLNATFAAIAGENPGAAGFTCQQLDRRFRSLGIDFTVDTVQELFDRADTNRDGLVGFAEWCEWGAVFPNTLECLYFRAQDRTDESRLREDAGAAREELLRHEVLTQPLRDELSALRARAAALREELDQNSRRQEECERRLRQADGDRIDEYRQRAAAYDRQLRELGQRRDRLDGQERELMEQEVRLERQREALRLQQQRFAHARAAFDRGAVDMGSPRRAVPMHNIT